MDLAILKPKREPPVAANVDGPDSGTSAFEWVQPEAWYVQVFDRRCGIQGLVSAASAILGGALEPCTLGRATPHLGPEVKVQ
jgi:hypothetical protein